MKEIQLNVWSYFLGVVKPTVGTEYVLADCEYVPPCSCILCQCFWNITIIISKISQFDPDPPLKHSLSLVRSQKTHRTSHHQNTIPASESYVVLAVYQALFYALFMHLF